MKNKMTKLPFAINNFYACTIPSIKKATNKYDSESKIDATIEKARQRLATALTAAI